MDSNEKPLMQFSVVHTAEGVMFCFKSSDERLGEDYAYTLMANELTLESSFDFVRFHIASVDGSSRTYRTVSNAYDQSAEFSPTGNWHAEGAVPSLRATMFTPGDTITLSISPWFEPKPGFAEKLWLIMTNWRGVNVLIHWKHAKSELVALKKTA